MIRLLRPRLCLSVFAITFCYATSADAFLITQGDEFSKFGDVPEAVRAQMRAEGADYPEVGYKYSHFGVFWLEIWTWNGEWCVFNEGKNEYVPLDKGTAAELLGKSPDDLGKPFRYKFPIGLLIIVVLIVLGLLGARAKKSGESKIKGLLNDSRYQQAVAMMQDHQETVEAQAAESGEPPPEDSAGFDKAVDFLASQGIQRAEAEQNLAAVLVVLAAAAEQDASPS